MSAPGIEHIVFFLEGPSEQDFLKAFLPAHLPVHINLHYQVFQGKQDMEKRLALGACQGSCRLIHAANC